MDTLIVKRANQFEGECKGLKRCILGDTRRHARGLSRRLCPFLHWEIAVPAREQYDVTVPCLECLDISGNELLQAQVVR